MYFLLSLFMLSKHSLHPKHSSQRGPNSPGPGNYEATSAVPGASVSPLLWFCLLSGACLQSIIGSQCVCPPQSHSGSAEGTWVHHLSGDVPFAVPRSPVPCSWFPDNVSPCLSFHQAMGDGAGGGGEGANEIN